VAAPSGTWLFPAVRVLEHGNRWRRA
jgi:hypothetical protein